MATKKKITEPDSEPDALIVDKASFKSKLLERIELEKELFSRHITSLEELEKNEIEILHRRP